MTSQVEPVPVPDCQVPTPPCVRLRTAQSSRLPSHPGTCVGLSREIWNARHLSLEAKAKAII